MRKIILLSFLLISFSGFAQDWAPFKTSDTIRHYSSSQNLQIQSVVVNSKLTVGSTTTLVFKKGFTTIYNPWYYKTQIIKGQIFGDTAIISTDSIIFKTRDSLGFSLSFPSQYYVNQTFILGTNVYGHQLKAVVDSIYSDSLNNSIDSLARMNLSFIDSLGLPDTSSNYHNVEVLISKNNGMIKGIDFTNLKVVEPIRQHFSINNRFTNAGHFSLTTNDEYHYSDNSLIAFFGDYYETIVRITNDSVSGNQRILTFEKRRQKVNPPPAGPVVTSVYNETFLNTTEFAVFESQIIEDSSLALTNNNSRLKVNLFFPCDYCGSNQTGLEVDSINYEIDPPFFTGKKDSLTDKSSGLNYGRTYIMIGVGDENYSSYGNNGNGPYSSSKSIVYVKKGSKTWGTPLTLAVGLDEERDEESELSLYPNPVNNVLKIDAVTNYSTIEVLNINGQLVATFAKQEEYNISGLNSGIYFLRIIADEGVITKKFIKE